MTGLPVRSVGHTGITVSDLGRSVAFYRDVMGFPVTRTVHLGAEIAGPVTGVPGAEIDIAFVAAPGHTLELLQYVRPGGTGPSSLRPCDPGCFHLCFMVDDIDQVVEAIQAAGFEPVGPVHTVTSGPRPGLRAIYTRDPDGVLLELMQEPQAPETQKQQTQKQQTQKQQTQKTQEPSAPAPSARSAPSPPG